MKFAVTGENRAPLIMTLVFPKLAFVEDVENQISLGKNAAKTRIVKMGHIVQLKKKAGLHIARGSVLENAKMRKMHIFLRGNQSRLGEHQTIAHVKTSMLMTTSLVTADIAQPIFLD